MPRTTKKTSKLISGKAPNSRPLLRGSIERSLLALARAMKRVGAKWYLFGAQAVALHGVPRATQDIDITVLTEVTTSVLVEALRAEGIIPRFDDEAFIATTRVIPADHAASGWKVDVVLGGPGLEELIASEASVCQVGRAAVPLLRLEHLLTLKTLANRPRDIADVSRLLAVHHQTLEAGAGFELHHLGAALPFEQVHSRAPRVLLRPQLVRITAEQSLQPFKKLLGANHSLASPGWNTPPTF